MNVVAGPIAPIGISLLNDEAVRDCYGKSVYLSWSATDEKLTLPEFRLYSSACLARHACPASPRVHREEVDRAPAGLEQFRRSNIPAATRHPRLAAIASSADGSAFQTPSGKSEI